MDYSDASDDDTAPKDSHATSRKRSSRACDQCRKSKSKCERVGNETCKGCTLVGTVCTFLGPSYKRGPPKGYIHAIESRWHQVESLLGAILQCPDARVQSIVSDLRTDELAREILGRVDAGPYGPSGRLEQPGGATKEDFFASILRSSGSTPSNDSSRSRRQSRVSREKVSSLQDRGLTAVPTREWQDNLSNRLASSSSSSSGSRSPSVDFSGVPLTQRRRLNGALSNLPAQPDWKDMYTLESDQETDEISHREAVEGMGALSLDEHQEVRFHGQVSGLYLLARSDRTDTRKEGGLWKLPMARVWPPIKDPTQIILEEDIAIELPSAHVQEHLLQLYFTYIHPVYPVLHKTRFLTEYNARNISSPAQSPDDNGLKTKPEPAQKFSSLLLMAMFAIAARFSEQDTPLPPKGKMWEAGGKYFNSAQSILAKVMHRSRPSTCQALLLLGYREFGLGGMEQGWIYIGMAIRMAIDLGLNCNLGDWKCGDGEQTLFGPEETQTRRQIWWACCLADRYGSIYMGRTVSIRDEDFDTPLPDDEEEQPWESLAPSGMGGVHYPGVTLATFRASGRLAMILGAIITKIYPVRPTSVASRQAALAKLESKLDQWYLSLPEGLRYDTALRRVAPPPPVLLLHIRYWGTVLLLHRAFIPNWKGTDPTPKNSPFELKAFDLAQGAASHTSAIVTAYRESFSLKRCSPFLTSYLLNSGDSTTVQSSGIARFDLVAKLKDLDLIFSTGFQQTLAALKEMEIIWPSAGRAWELLTGVKLPNTIVPPPQSHDRHKRHAEDAFGQDRAPDYPLREDEQVAHNVDGVQDMANKLMAHMLGLDLPGVEPSTSFYTGCDWWARPNQDSNHSMPSENNWRQSGSGPLFAPLSLPTQGGWQLGSRDVHYNADGSVYQYDHFGV